MDDLECAITQLYTIVKLASLSNLPRAHCLLPQKSIKRLLHTNQQTHASLNLCLRSWTGSLETCTLD